MTETAQDSGPLRVDLLGPVRAWRGHTELDLGSARRRAVFAILALRANQAVSRDELISGIWGEHPPASVEGSLYTYVSGLRRALDPDRTRWSSGHVLISAGSGYCLRIEEDNVDVRRFERLRELAADQIGRGAHRPALRTLRRALDLWHGDALAGIDCPFADAHRARLGELRLATLEQRADTLLAIGEHGEAIAELSAQIRAHPLRETMRGLLVLALHRAGRPTEAVSAYQEARTALIEELGIEPGPALRRAHAQIRTVAPPPDAPPRTATPTAVPGFTGRTTETASLRERLHAVSTGQGGAVWIEGEPGIGKSSLLATALRDPGVRVLWGAGDELGGRFPLRMIRECLGADGDDEPGAYTWRTGDPVLAAVERLLTRVDQLCADGPLVLVLDDLQWADGASLLVWHRLSRATRRIPLLLIGACRPVPRRAELDQVRVATLAGGAELLRLDPLDEDEIADMVSAIVGAEPGAGLLGHTDRAAGNPRYCREILDALAGAIELDDGIAEVDADPGPTQPALCAAVTRRLGFLAGPVRELLRWAALLGPEFDLTDLSAVTGARACDLVARVEDAVAAGVLREAGTRFAFRHPLVCQVLRDDMPTAVRVALHRQAAEALDGAGAVVDRIADQLLAAPLTVDGWVTEWLLANIDAVAARAPVAATALLERVVAWPGISDVDRETATARLARLLFRLGRRPAAEARAVLAMTADPAMAAEMRLILAYVDFSRGDVDGALAILRASAADPDVPDHWRARHQSLQAMIERCGLDDLTAAERTAHHALARARKADDPFAIAHSLQDLWQIESVRRAHPRALRHVEDALSAVRGRDHGDLQLSLLDNKVFTLQNLDRLDEATATLATAQDLVARRGIGGGLHIPAAVHYFWLGRWDAAIAELAAVVRDGPEITFYGLRQRGAILLMHGAAALIAAHRGDTGELAAHLADANDWPAAIVTDREHCDFLLAAAAIAAEQRDRPDEALAILAPMLDPRYARMMLRHQWLPTVVRLALDTGEDEVAARALSVCEQERAAEAEPARATAAVAWCRGLVDHDPETLVDVGAYYARVGRRVEFAGVMADAAVLLAESGQPDRAREAFHDSLVVHTELGAVWDVTQAERRLRRYGIRRVASAGDRPVLSAVEARVAFPVFVKTPGVS